MFLLLQRLDCAELNSDLVLNEMSLNKKHLKMNVLKGPSHQLLTSPSSLLLR